MDEMVEVTSCMERDGRDGGGNKLYGNTNSMEQT